MVAVSIQVFGVSQAASRIGALALAAREWGSASIEVGSTSPIARYVIGGTRPHTIRPRNARALSWPGAAHPVPSVNHPGTRPNPFAAEALADQAPRVQARMVQSLDAVAAGAPASSVRVAISNSRANVLRAVRARAPSKSGGLRSSLYTRTVLG